jgi:hypothetical protein
MDKTLESTMKAGINPDCVFLLPLQISVAHLIGPGLIPGLLCEFVRRAHFGVEEVGKQLAL